MREYIIQICCALVGSFGFSVVFRLKRDKIVLASLGGGLTWLLYLVLFAKVKNEFMAYFWSTVFATFYAEAMARIYKAPVTIFVIPAIVPLIPGGCLYYTMEYLLQSDTSLFREKAAETAMLALAIAMGITIVIMLMDLYTLIAGKIKKTLRNS